GAALRIPSAAAGRPGGGGPAGRGALLTRIQTWPPGGGAAQERDGMTELGVFWGRGATARRSMREPDLPDPAFTGRRLGGRRRRDRGARRPVDLDAVPRDRPRGRGGLPDVRLAPGLQRVLDLRVLDLELERAGQWRREIERYPGDQQKQDPARSHRFIVPEASVMASCRSRSAGPGASRRGRP